MTKKKRQPVECVQSMPPACPKCGCTDRTEKECVTFKERDIVGTTREGRKYTKIQWNYTNCKNCGQHYRFMEYLYPASRTSDKKGLIGSGTKPRSGNGFDGIKPTGDRQGQS